jgi:hypothetical protein
MSKPTRTPSYSIAKPQVILHLYHGRNTPDEDMDGWGFDGPRIPVVCVGFTYETLWYYTDDRYDLKISGGCVEWEGKYYGDFEVIAVEARP